MSIRTVPISLTCPNDILDKAVALKKRYEHVNSEQFSNLHSKLQYIDQTHTIPVQQVFKPHTPVACEYMKYNARQPKFGSTATFKLKSLSADFISDMVLHVKISGLSVVDARDRVRYIAMPGHKFGTKYEFCIDTRTLEDYDPEIYNIHYNFKLKEEQRKNWLRCMGQETRYEAFLTPDPQVDMYRQYHYVGNGAQTLKQRHDELELFIPLMFWFRDNPFYISNLRDQCEVNISISDIKELVSVADYGGGGKYKCPTISVCSLYVNTIFTSSEISNLFSKYLNFSLIHTHTFQFNTINTNNITDILLKDIKYFVEELYIAFRPRANKNLSQHWYKYSNLKLQQIPTPVMIKNPAIVLTGTIDTVVNENSIQINGLGLSPHNNYYVGYYFVITGGTGFSTDDVVKNRYTVSKWDPLTSQLSISTTWNIYPAADTTWELYTLQPGTQFIEFYEESPVVDTLELRAHDIHITKLMPANIYNQYTPMKNMYNSSCDSSVYVINFNTKPHDHNPSGYFNISKIKELYLHWTSKNISEDNPVDLIIIGKSMNFLVIEGSNICFRYT